MGQSWSCNLWNLFQRSSIYIRCRIRRWWNSIRSLWGKNMSKKSRKYMFDGTNFWRSGKWIQNFQLIKFLTNKLPVRVTRTCIFPTKNNQFWYFHYFDLWKARQLYVRYVCWRYVRSCTISAIRTRRISINCSIVDVYSRQRHLTRRLDIFYKSVARLFGAMP